jgi:2,4-dienoyl-CoA reductase-like NADH-dependent reductase (Old Yellow Enzyme family)/thioredoxin reductase
MAVFEHLFAPLRVGQMTVKNRIVMAPMERNYANPDGTVSARSKAHYTACARGGVGWIDVESTFVDPKGRGRTHQLGIHEDRCIPGFKELTDIAHSYGARISLEVHHAGRNTSRAISGFQPVAPSPLPCMEAGGDIPHELSAEEIEEIIGRYGQAARRAREAGFDAVELHSAHGYLPLAFLSPYTNRRADEYGGSFENRLRFPLRVIRAIRENVGADLTVGCRFSADQFIDGGLTIDDTAQYARRLEQAGVDYLHVSAGIYESFEVIIPPMDAPNGFLLPLASAIKRAVSIPVIAVSRINDPVFAEKVLADGQADLVAFGRAFLTDPEFPNKARAGRADDIVKCIGCNQGCVARIAIQQDVTCLVNPVTGREVEFEIRPAKIPKKVLVVGGGPAGMEAARVSAARGHHVSLYEQNSDLGSLVRLLAKAPHQEDWSDLVRSASRQLSQAGVSIQLNTKVDEDLIRLVAPDVLIVAAGAVIQPEDIPGAGRVAVTDIVSVLDGRAVTGNHVVVVGGGRMGLVLAEWLSYQGTKVTIVERSPVIAQDMETARRTFLMRRLQQNPLIICHTEKAVREIVGGSVVIGKAGAIGPLFVESLSDVDTIVLADRRCSANGLAWLAREKKLAPEIFEIGDCLEPRTALEAIFEAAVVGRKI